MTSKRSRLSRLTLLAYLVLFVFLILLTSMIVGVIIIYILHHMRLIPPISENRLPLILCYMLIVSLCIGTVLAIVAGNFSLRPLKCFTYAIKEIGAGNFDVRIPLSGPDEFKKLAKSFNNMAEGLGGIETLRSDFVNNISHEFKTPIVSIRGFAKLLKNDNLTPQQRNEYLDIILQESDRLTTLSTNVLLLSNLENTDFAFETNIFSLDEQLREVILMLNPQFEDRQINISLAENIYIDANEELLQHVWINLLNNAIKFTTSEDSISIALDVYDDEAVVWVKDTGIGMTEDTQKRIFDKFYQENSSRSTNGNGLGLSLVRKILALNHGTINVVSKVDTGSVFSVHLPIVSKVEVDKIDTM